MERSFDSLRKIQLHERSFGALAALDDAFYDEFGEWLDSQKGSLEKEFSIEALRAYENAKKILSEIRERREEKILRKALLDLRNKGINSEGMSREEKRLYLDVIALLNKFENSGEETIVEEAEKPRESEGESVKLLHDVPAFVAPFDGETYGPFAAKQVVRLKREVADLLLKKNVAEKEAEVALA